MPEVSPSGKGSQMAAPPQTHLQNVVFILLDPPPHTHTHTQKYVFCSYLHEIEVHACGGVMNGDDGPSLCVPFNRSSLIRLL
jgi:hypothetical protein